jgi:predicted SnoaL-like aldol condensation-catalyzing enzyme
MTSSNHTLLVQRLAAEVYNQRNLAMADTLLAPIIRINDHEVSAEDLKQAVLELDATIPGFRVAIKIISVAGDLVAAQWTIQRGGRVDPPAHQPAGIGFRIFRIADGKIVEMWLNRAAISRLHLLGPFGMSGLPGRCGGPSLQPYL